MPRTYFVTFTWNVDGRPGSTHVDTDDIDAYRAADEGAQFLAVTWQSVTDCPDWWTCTHTRDFRASL